MKNIVKGKLTFVKGDVTSPQLTLDNEYVFIPHCCNDLGVMGAGVAKSLVNKWPAVITVYKEICSSAFKTGTSCLGEVDYVNVEKNISVFNMIGQKGTVSFSNHKPLKYAALVDAMRKVAHYTVMLYMTFKNENLERHVIIHTPKFGSDLAGGNWDFILELIQEIWVDNGIDVVVYEFEADKNKWGLIV